MRPHVELAKDCVDVGIYTNRVDEQRAFWGERVGLPYEELLKVGGGVHQHRYGLRGSVLKLNASRNALPDDASPFRSLTIGSSALGEALVDPDGTAVRLAQDVGTIAIEWATGDAARLGSMLAAGFGATNAGDERWCIGTTTLVLVEDDADGDGDGERSRARAGADGPLVGRGIRYLTVQVRDVKAAHAHLLDVGWSEGRAPIKLGEVAFISFVRGPDGGWIEVSQRASLTGPLPGA